MVLPAAAAAVAATWATSNIEPVASLLTRTVNNLFNPFANGDTFNTSLTSFGKTGRISSRVYIDASVAQDTVITDVLKTIHTQYCGLILTALQMNQLVSDGKTIQDLLKVVATEDMQIHQDVASVFMSTPGQIEHERRQRELAQRHQREEENARRKQERDEDIARREKERSEDRENREKDDRINRFHKDQLAANDRAHKDKLHQSATGLTGKVVSFAGDNHIPAGKVIEVTFTNPDNPNHKITVNILVQLAPYIVPEDLAVQFIVKDQQPSFYQRWIQWRTGEISFWKDFIFQSDIIRNHEKLMKLDPSGVFASMTKDQTKQQLKTLENATVEKAAERARNISNSVLIFNQDTVTRAKSISGIDLNDYASRQKYFATTFAMMIVIIDTMYNRVTFYYNGIEDVGTFSFEQMTVSSKNNNSMDLVSVMQALSQGKSPKF